MVELASDTQYGERLPVLALHYEIILKLADKNSKGGNLSAFKD